MEFIEQKIKGLLFALGVSRKSEAEMRPEDYLQATLGLDSLSLIELVIAVEEEFGIVVTDEEILDQDSWIKTIGSLTQFVEGKTGGLALA